MPIIEGLVTCLLNNEEIELIENDWRRFVLHNDVCLANTRFFL